MFKNSTENKNNYKTIIGSEIIIEGNFNGSGDILIDGAVNGSIKTDSDVIVTNDALINGDVNAKNIFISGHIKGNIIIEEKIKLNKSAKVFGDISCKFLEIEEGAVFNGNSKIENNTVSTKDN